MKRIWGWVLIGVAVTLMVTLGIVRAQSRTLSWTAVTKYTDGTPIEAGNAVTYSAWRQDSTTSIITQLANRIPATSVPFDDATLVKGRVYKFWVQAQVATGAPSDNSTVLAWTNPTGQAETPAGLVVQ